jgi:hypothetical protein
MCYCVVDVFKMYMYSNEECVDVQFVYVFCDGNAAADVKEYKKQFANW